MPGTLRIRITPVEGEITDLRYRYMWSAWLDKKLLDKGYCLWPEQARELALDLVIPDEVERIAIVEHVRETH